MAKKITSYNIDENEVLHTWIGNLKHVTISDVKNNKQAKQLIKELDAELEDDDAESKWNQT